MKKAVFILLILGIAVAGLGWRQWHQTRGLRHANLGEFDPDMTAGLLNGIFQELGAEDPPVYFVAFGEARTEPDEAFIARFADHIPPVRSFTASVSTPNGLVLETSTGRPGVIIQIIHATEYIPGTFDVLVELSNLPARHNRFFYRLSNVGGEWKIEGRKPA
jgi:hypothetical protein